MDLLNRRISRRRCVAVTAGLTVLWLPACRRVGSAQMVDASRPLPAGWQVSNWEQLRGARRGFSAVSEIAQENALVTTHDLAADQNVAAGALSLLLLSVAGLRAGVIDQSQTFVCDGSRCERAHGSIRPSDALALGCRGYYSIIAPRVGAASLAAAVSVLGFRSLAIPEDPESRARLSLHGTGWNLSLSDALILASHLREQQRGGDGNYWSEACVPRGGAVGPLRGVVAADETSAWFIGWAQLSSPKLVAVYVTDCTERSSSVVLRAALSLFAQARVS